MRKALSGFEVASVRLFCPTVPDEPIAQDLNQGAGIRAAFYMNRAIRTGQHLQLACLLDIAIEQNQKLSWLFDANSPACTRCGASNGSTSSVGIFWLIPAMRRKDRSGPGMTTPSAARDTDFPAGAVLVTRDEELD